MDYREFLMAKACAAPNKGFTVRAGDVHPILKPHQRDIAQWMLSGGRRACFAAFGLGKTMIQLEVMRHAALREGGRQLIVCPLGVRQEFKADAAKLGIGLSFIRRDDELSGNPGMFVTNYESIRDGRLSVEHFNAVSLDEASVLRSFGSKTYQSFLSLFSGVKYRFVATATPSPNRYKELIHYAGFLGVMDTGQALAQPLTSKVLTPSGWVQMGDIRAGDHVVGRNGKPTRVLGVYPQGEKTIFRVTFSDGSSTRCTEDHLWLTRTQYQRNAAKKFRARNPEKSDTHYWTVKTTRELMGTLRCESTGSKNHMVPMVEPVQFPKRGVSIDPYLLGFLLGDGNFRPTAINFTTADDWIVNHLRKIVSRDSLLVFKNEHIRKDGQPNYDYRISAGKAGRIGRGHQSNAILRAVRDMGLLRCRAWEKFIPQSYLFNSPDVRLAILQGLMDADGTVSSDERNRTTRLCTTSRRLAEGVQFIAQSLGGTAQIFERNGRTPTGKAGRIQYVVTLRLPNGHIPFRLPRKASRVVERQKYHPARYIDTIEPCGTEEAQCIAVEDGDHLYVTDDFIVTHNTRFFQRDSQKANNLTLYPHKEDEFWLWVSSWAIFLQKPSDIGYSDEGYDLPPLHVHYHQVTSESVPTADRDGQLRLIADAALSLKDASREKRASLPARIEKLLEIVEAAPAEHCILWHDQEAERHAIKKALPEAVEVYGSQDLEARENNIVAFSNGEIKYLATKPILSGSGCNFQRHCATAIFLGIGFKFNDFIQAIHRIHRFLQERECHIHIICACLTCCYRSGGSMMKWWRR